MKFSTLQLICHYSAALSIVTIITTPYRTSRHRAIKLMTAADVDVFVDKKTYGLTWRVCVCAEFYSTVALRAARRACAAADAVIVVGTSLSVYPAAELPQLARIHNPGALLIEINAVHAVRLFGFSRSPSGFYLHSVYTFGVLFVHGTPETPIDDNITKQ